jgi:D-alanine-D-alanine ligase
VRICLLTNQDLDGDGFPEDDWPCDPRPFLPNDEWHVATLLENKTSVRKVEALIKQGFDLFFNLCDGPLGYGDPGIEVVRTLEKHGVPFTGASSKFFEPTRLQMKAACKKLGIATPKGVVVRSEDDIEKAVAALRFPMFVKYYSSYASVDISRNSRVQTEAGLRLQVRKILSKHKAALVEEYIGGTECTVLVAENPKNPKKPTTYTPVQYQFPDGETFKHENLKWVDYEGLMAFPVKDPVLAQRLRDESARFFTELHGASYGRCDIRVSEDGTPHMLEINPNCGVYFEEKDYGSADFCLSLDAAGHIGFTKQLVKAAFARAKSRV